MKNLLLIFILLSTAFAFSQTKVIAFKSHSGNMNHFFDLVVNRDVEMSCHNLGVGPQRIITEALLDTVIYVDDTTTIMVTSQTCRNEYATQDQSWLWKAGKDTIINNEIWNNDKPKEIKRKLKKDFNFQNDMDSVVFIGFPEKEKMDPRREAGGIIDEDNNEIIPLSKKPEKPGMGMPIALVSATLLALIIGLLSWRKAHFKALKQDILS